MEQPFLIISPGMTTMPVRRRGPPVEKDRARMEEELAS
jgi:hypothetical protein